MTELSNAVTVLIARMESHPEDFDMSAIDAPRFGHLAPYLTKLAGGGDELGHRHAHSYVEEPFWFLSEADKQALAEAWKKYHYKYFEKRTMEKIFDDGAEEREREIVKLKARVQAQQAAMMQGTPITSSPYISNARPGLISPLHNTIGNGYQNAAQNTIGSSNTGLLGSAGNAGLLGGLTGLFK